MTQIQENKLPEGWIETTLGELIKIGRGSSPRPIQNFIVEKNGIPWVKIADATASSNRYIESTKEFIKEEGRSTTVLYGDLIVSNSATPGIPKFMRIEACVHDGWLVFSEYKKLDKLYLYYFFLDYRIRLEHSAFGTVFKNLTTEIVRNVPISLPPLPEQQAIAKILSSFDDKIELLREQNETLEKIGQELFKEWFGKYKVGDELPEGWKVGKLGEVLKFIKGKKPNNTSEIFIDGYIPQILIETFDSGKVTYANPKNTVLISENDLIMVMDGASSGRLEIGYSGIVGSTLSKIEVDEKLKMMIYAFLKSKFKEINNGTTGSSIPHTDKAKIFNFDFFVTDENYINDFNKLYGSFLYKVLDNKKQIQTLSKTRDELLPKLMRGEVRGSLDL